MDNIDLVQKFIANRNFQNPAPVSVKLPIIPKPEQKSSSVLVNSGIVLGGTLAGAGASYTSFKLQEPKIKAGFDTEIKEYKKTLQDLLEEHELVKTLKQVIKEASKALTEVIPNKIKDSLKEAEEFKKSAQNGKVTINIEGKQTEVDLSHVLDIVKERILKLELQKTTIEEQKKDFENQLNSLINKAVLKPLEEFKNRKASQLKQIIKNKVLAYTAIGLVIGGVIAAVSYLTNSKDSK